MKDVAICISAVMSGVSSPDFHELLVGEDHGRIYLSSIGFGDKTVRSMERSEFRPAPAPRTGSSRLEVHVAADKLLSRGQFVPIYTRVPTDHRQSGCT